MSQVLKSSLRRNIAAVGPSNKSHRGHPTVRFLKQQKYKPRQTYSSPFLKRNRSAAKRRLSFSSSILSSSSSNVRAKRNSGEGDKTVVSECDEELRQGTQGNRAEKRIQEVVSSLLKSGNCKVYSMVGSYISPTPDEEESRLLEAKEELTSMLESGSRGRYHFRVMFETVPGVKVKDGDGEAISLIIGRRRAPRHPSYQARGKPFIRVFQALFASRCCHERKYPRALAKKTSSRPVLLVTDSEQQQLFAKVRPVISSLFKVGIAPLKPLTKEDILLVSGRILLIKSVEKSLEGVMREDEPLSLAATIPSIGGAEPEEHRVECQIPLLHLNDFISHTTVAEVTDGNVRLMWHELGESFPDFLPQLMALPITQVSFHGFDLSSKGDIYVKDASLEICLELLESLTKCSQGGMFKLF